MSHRLQVTFANDQSVFGEVVKLAEAESRSRSSMAEILIKRGIDAPDPKAMQLVAAAECVGGIEAAIAILGRSARARKVA